MESKKEITKKKICFVTAARSEYGLLKWLMKDIDASEEFVLQLIVTGGHLLKEQGYTIDGIINDGLNINAKVDARVDATSEEAIAASMGRIAEGIAHSLAELHPDYLVILGDRYELLPICNTAFVMHIPIIHISGGDVTEGAIDDGIRNAVSMLAQYHFPGTEDSARNIARMRGTDKNIWVVGELGLDSFSREYILSRKEIVDDLQLNENAKWVLFTYHPETRASMSDNINTVKICIEELLRLDNVQVVATYSNADYGGKQINEFLEKQSQVNPSILKVVPSLGNRRYLSLMRQVSFVIGNSSSGIIETPVLGVPVVNIGDRQKGRYQSRNIIQTDRTKKKILNAINRALEAKDFKPDYYWGDGHSSEKIMRILKEIILVDAGNVGNQ